MQRFFLIILISLATLSTSNAQNLYGFNLGGMLNITNSTDSAKSMTRMGTVVEGYYLRQFSPMFFGKLGVGYSLRGYQGNFREFIEPDSVNGEVIRSAWMHYVDVPIMIGLTSRNAFVEIGGIFSFNVANQPSDEYYFPDKVSGTLLRKETPDLALNAFHVSFGFNVGYRFILKDNLNLNLALRTSMLQNLSTSLKGQYFGLVIGLTFGTPLEGTNDAYDFEEEQPVPDGD